MEQVLPHPAYDGGSRDYDLALLRLKEPLNFSGESSRPPSAGIPGTSPAGVAQGTEKPSQAAGARAAEAGLKGPSACSKQRQASRCTGLTAREVGGRREC